MIPRESRAGSAAANSRGRRCVRRDWRQRAEKEGSPSPTVPCAAAEPLEQRREGQSGQQPQQHDPQGVTQGGEYPQGETSEVAEEEGEGQGERGLRRQDPQGVGERSTQGVGERGTQGVEEGGETGLEGGREKEAVGGVWWGGGSGRYSARGGCGGGRGGRWGARGRERAGAGSCGPARGARRRSPRGDAREVAPRSRAASDRTPATSAATGSPHPACGSPDCRGGRSPGMARAARLTYASASAMAPTALRCGRLWRQRGLVG